ncbi:MAG: metallophosphoesterase family protein [Firmicutes bacterium]|nr:metallophosphoesterase family protein [Bacillota bacterium]
MKILIVSDEENRSLWDYYTPGKLKDFDLILSCGDLKSDYLQFLVTMARCPLLYVHGNHDEHYETRPPEGCDCLDGGIVEYNGIRILGLGGCRKYRPGAHQYTDREMRRRIFRLEWRLRRMGGVDIVVTHAAPEGLGDGEDIAHRGFPSFRRLLERHPPRFWFFGHVHLQNGDGSSRTLKHRDTELINCCRSVEVEIPDRSVPEKKKNRLIWITGEPVIKDPWGL